MVAALATSTLPAPAPCNARKSKASPGLAEKANNKLAPVNNASRRPDLAPADTV